MLKRNILLATLGIAVIIFSILGYFSLREGPVKITALDAIGLNASAVLRVNDYRAAQEKLLLNNLMWQELIKDQDIDLLNTQLIQFDSLFRSDEWSLETFDESRLTISFHAAGDNQYNQTFYATVPGPEGDNLFDWFVSISSSVTSYSVFEEVEIRSAQMSIESSPLIYFSHTEGLLIASFKPDLVEDAIRVLHSGNSILTNKDFAKVEKTTGNFSYWNLMLNYGDDASMNFLGFNPDFFNSEDQKISGWTALDATLHPDLLLLNGFSNVPSNSFLSLFNRQKSQDADAIDIMPENVSLFFHFGVSNYEEYTKSKKNYFKAIGKEEVYKDKLQAVRTEFQIDLEDELNQWIGNEFGVMYLSGMPIEKAKTKIAFFRLSDKKRAINILSALSGNNDSEDEESIQRLPINNFLDDFETNVFSGLDQPYYTILDKYILFCNDSPMLEFVRTQYIKDITLKKSEAFASFTRNLTDQSNFYLYADLKDGFPVFEEALSTDLQGFIGDHENVLKKFQHVGIQFKDGKNDLFYQHTAIDYNPKQQSEGNMLWEIALDTTVTMKPQIVYNHYTNAREIFIQDASNKIYLIDNKGNILWSRLLKEPIKSPVYQIDALKNNKLQILFSGESSIYLIDRKGRDVDNFPIQLSAVSTNGITVIDYEKNREYRILVGVRGGEILNFDRFGKKVTGWKFKQNEEVVGRIDYFMLGNKDYLVTVGSEGTPFIINRRGESRISLNESLPMLEKQDRPIFSLELSNDISQCKIVATDASGTFVKLKFNGEKENVNLDLFSDAHKFLYDDLNNDRKFDYVILDSNRLMAFDHNKEKMFEVHISVADPSNLNVYRFESGFGRIGFTDKKNENIYLYQDAGSISEGFPIKGSGDFTIIDLNKDGRNNLIVGYQNKLVTYNIE